MLLPVGLSLVAITIQRFWPASTVIGIYWNLKLAFEAFESQILFEFIGADGPYEDWAAVQRDQRYFHLSYFAMCLFFNSESTVYGHITKNIGECDPLSQFSLVFIIFRTIQCAESYSV